MATAQVPSFYTYISNPFRMDFFPEDEFDSRDWAKMDNELEIPVSVPSGFWASPVNSFTMTANPYSTPYGNSSSVSFIPSQGGNYCFPPVASALPSFGSTSLVSLPQMSQISMAPEYYNYLSEYVKGIPTTASTVKEESISSSTSPDNKKRKREKDRNTLRRMRQTRPKVVESKGAIQCKGTNRKRGAQCRNAALMEYIGPRPQYCAEHIELDPESLYEKCKSPYQKEPSDNKGCKEVVLKEFGLCYKHYADAVSSIIKEANLSKAKKDLQRTTELLAQLEREASAAKKKDGDLYQRKNKLIPKFLEMKRLAAKAVEEICALHPHKKEIQEFQDQQLLLLQQQQQEDRIRREESLVLHHHHHLPLHQHQQIPSSRSPSPSPSPATSSPSSSITSSPDRDRDGDRDDLPPLLSSASIPDHLLRVGEGLALPPLLPSLLPTIPSFSSANTLPLQIDMAFPESSFFQDHF